MQDQSVSNIFDPFGAGMSGAQFIEAAGSGGFELTSDHAEHLADSLQAAVDDLTKILDNTRMLDQPPPMSASPAGLFISKVMHDTATDQEGMRTQLARAKEELPKYVEGLRLAAKRYRDTEQSNAADIQTLNPGT